MMENYFNVFKSPNIQIESKLPSAVVGIADRNDLKENIEKGVYNAQGVTVTISNAAQKYSLISQEKTLPIASVYEPKDGVMVKKDSAGFSSNYQDLDKRITMIEVDNNGKDITSNSMKNLLENIESNSLELSSLIKNSGGFNSDKTVVHGRVELGNIRGGDFLFDKDGNIVGQKYVGMVDEVENTTQVNINLTTERGIKVELELELMDKISQQGAIGLSRDSNFSYATSGELSDNEIKSLNTILESLQDAYFSFHGDNSITQAEADNLINSMSAESDIFSSITAQLKMEKGELSRSINASMDEHGNAAIDSNEKGMETAYHVSSFSTDTLQMHMGDSRTNLDVLKEVKESNNSSLVYKQAIEASTTNSTLGYGEYISSFFDVRTA